MAGNWGEWLGIGTKREVWDEWLYISGEMGRWKYGNDKNLPPFLFKTINSAKKFPLPDEIKPASPGYAIVHAVLVRFAGQPE